jgi:hypothetical protein
MMAVMFKGIMSIVVAAGLFYQADQHLYDGRHAEAIMSLARGVLHSVGL